MIIGIILLMAPVVVFADVNISILPGAGNPNCEVTQTCFSENFTVIGLGETISWSNKDNASHTITSGGPATGPTGEFNSQLFGPGSKFSVTFNKSGERDYFCIVHPWMTGTVIVNQQKGEEIKPLRDLQNILSEQITDLEVEIQQINDQISILEQLIQIIQRIINQVRGDELDFEARITSIDSNSFTVEGFFQEIFVNDATQFGEGIDSLSDLMVGFRVSVDIILSNGSHIASQIQLK